MYIVIRYIIGEQVVTDMTFSISIFNGLVAFSTSLAAASTSLFLDIFFL